MRSTKNRNLAQVFNQRLQRSSLPATSNSPINSNSFVAFLRIFSYSINDAFPEATTIDDLDYDQVQRIAERSLVCADVALETWDNRESISTQTSSQAA